MHFLCLVARNCEVNVVHDKPFTILSLWQLVRYRYS